MSASGSIAERFVLAVGSIVIGIPGILLLFDTEGYANGKDNLVVSPDLFSELRALGAIFLAAAVVMLIGNLHARLRTGALVVGLVAFLPQGIARLVSYGLNDGQHESYLRAGVLEVIIGVVIAVLAVRRIKQESAEA